MRNYYQQMLKIHSGLLGLRSVMARRLPAKSFDLTEKIVKYLAIWETKSSSLRNPLRLLAQSLGKILNLFIFSNFVSQLVIS